MGGRTLTCTCFCRPSLSERTRVNIHGGREDGGDTKYIHELETIKWLESSELWSCHLVTPVALIRLIRQSEEQSCGILMVLQRKISLLTSCTMFNRGELE